MLQVMSVSGRRVHLRLGENAGSVFYRKPRGVASAVIFTWTGEGLPGASSVWTYGGTTSTVNVKFTIDDPALQPGSRVWFAAAWVNPRGQQGPMCDPRDAYLQYEMTVPSLQQAA